MTFRSRQAREFSAGAATELDPGVSSPSKHAGAGPGPPDRLGLPPLTP